MAAPVRAENLSTLPVPPNVPFVRLQGFDDASDRVKDFIHFTEGEANAIYGKINTVSNLLDWILYLLKQYQAGNLSTADIMNLKRYIRMKLGHVGSQMNSKTKNKAREIVDLLDTLVPADSAPPLDPNGQVMEQPAFPRTPFDTDVSSEDPEFSSQLLLKDETPEILARRTQALRDIMAARTAQRTQLQGIKDANDGQPKGPRYQAILRRRGLPVQPGGARKTKKAKKGKKVRKTRH
jgi:hypothetical protein